MSEYSGTDLQLAEKALKYCQNDKEVMQNQVDVFEEQVRKLEAVANKAWWHRMSNEDIAAELSATFDLNLELTREIAGWMLTEKAEHEQIENPAN